MGCLRGWRRAASGTCQLSTGGRVGYNLPQKVSALKALTTSKERFDKMIRYCFKNEEMLTIKGAADADPQKIGEELAKIQEQHGGELKARFLWQAAEGKPRHVLHRHFTWDVREAAEAHWDRQARSLIQCIHVEEGKGKKRHTMSAYLSIRAKDGTSYRTVADVLGSHDLQRRVLEQATRDLLAFENRYRQIDDICVLVREARERIEQKIVRASQPSQVESRPAVS